MKYDKAFFNSLERVIPVFKSKDPLKMATVSGSDYEPEGNKITVRFLNERYVVSHPDGLIPGLSDSSIPEQVLKILLLHYLVNCKNVPLNRNLVSFRHLPGAVSYENAFKNRAIKPIANMFSNNIRGLQRAALKLGGIENDYGDIAYKIQALPKIPLVYLLWKGDKDIDGSANILFDQTASQHLPTEDLAVLAELTTAALIES